MALDMTFKQVAAFIKKDQPDLVDVVDKLLGMSLICSPLLFGPAALPLLSLLTAKNDLVRIGKSIFDAVVGKKDADFLAHHERMQKAYGLICYTAFFEALDASLSDGLRENFKLLATEKAAISKRTSGGRQREKREAEGETAADLGLATIAFPHPLEKFSDQEARLTGLYGQLAGGFGEFIKGLAYWDALDEKGKASLQEILKRLPEAALRSFHAQYFALAQKYDDFGVWANLHEHDKTAKAIHTLSQYVRQYGDLIKSERASIDIGFAKLHAAVQSIPEVLQSHQAEEVVEGLRRHYAARVAEPIVEDKYEPQEDQPQLTFPSIQEAFIPQSYRALRHTGRGSRLESEETWSGLEAREDLGALLLSYLSSPYSIETPLVVLGHPGSGKSLLTKVLSATLLSREFTPIRVPLREVDSDAPLESQIEQAISAITGHHIDGWAHFSGRFRNHPPVVILDGYDELLQASGKVFSGYLTGVRNFQHKEAEQGRPVRVIVTSRLTLIDKATMPPGATIVRLLEFDRKQRDKWISIWNRANRNYFKTSSPPVQPFALPAEDDPDGKSVLALSEQPLLLLMLAIYDSDRNRLRNSKGLDRTILYDSLLRRFVERELKKGQDFEDLKQKERQEQVDRDMQRLGVAAIGMYNRRKLHILSQELNGDVTFFDLERKVPVGDGRPLSQADMLLGSFFFVHKSKAKQRGEGQEQYEESAAFEFLHNTFGEFLTADFILRQAITEADSLLALSASESLGAERQRKLDARDGFATSWFACLIYTPLFSRPVVLEMIREWVDHSLQKRKRSKQDFLKQLDEIILNQIRRVLCLGEMPGIMQGKVNAPFGQYPLLGHVAIYSMNLIILRTVLANGPFMFDEESIGSHEDGSRPWDQLTHVWRSWFSLDNLSGLTAILEAIRQGAVVELTAKNPFGTSTSENRLETVLNVGIALADNITSGLAGLASYNPQTKNRLTLSEIATRLKDENIELRLQMLVRELLGVRPSERGEDGGVREMAAEAMRLAIETGRWDQFRAIVGSLIGRKDILEDVLGELFNPQRSPEFFHRRPEAFLEALRVAREVGTWHWLRRWGFEAVERFFHRGGWEEMVHRLPSYGTELVLLSHEWGARPLGRGLRGPKGFPGEMLDELFDRVLRGDDGRLTGRVPNGQAATEATVAALLLALDGRGPERQRIAAEDAERLLGPREMVRMLEEWPGATIELCLLALGSRAPKWLAAMADAWVMEFASPGTVLKLLRRRPESGIELIRLLRRIQAGTPFDRGRPFKPKNFGDLGDPRYVMEVLHGWPDAGSELARLLSEGNPEWLEAFAERWMHDDLHPRAMVDLLYDLPEVAIQVLHRSASLMQNERPLHWVREALRPRVFMDILDRRPKVAVELLRFLRTTQGRDVGDEFTPELLNSVLKRDHPPNWLGRNPEVVVELLHLIREKGGPTRLPDLDHDWFEASFPPELGADLFLREPAAANAVLQLAAEIGGEAWIRRFAEALTMALHQGRRALLEQISIAQLQAIKSIADQAQNERLSSMLETMVGGLAWSWRDGEHRRDRPKA